MADTLPPGEDDYPARGRSRMPPSMDRGSRFNDWDYDDGYRRRSSPRRRSRSRERRRDYDDYDDNYDYETIEYDHRTREDREYYRERDRSYRREKTRRDYDHYDRLRSDKNDGRRRDDRYSRGYDTDRRYREGYDDNGDHSSSTVRQEPTPSAVLVLRGLPLTTVDDDLYSIVKSDGLQCKDVRMIRDRNGDSKGFAFVEFADVSTAEKWMAIVKGELTIDKKDVSVEYSRQRSNSQPLPPIQDWNCPKCSTLNYASRHRRACFNCGAYKDDDDDEEPSIKTDHRRSDKEPIAAPPCNVLILRGLDTKTSEEAVRNAIVKLTTCPIYDVRLIKDKITGASRGFCFIEMGSIEDATKLIETIQSSEPSYKIDSRDVYIGYARNSPNPPPGKAKQSSWSDTSTQSTITLTSSGKPSSSLASVAIAQAQAAQRQGNQAPDPYSSQQYAQGAPVVSATNTTAGMEMYRNGSWASFATPDANGMSNLGAGVYSQQSYGHAGAMQGSGLAGMVYDAASGYYYDANSGLHYDANTGYYYNSTIGKFLFWDQNSQQYYEVNQDGSMGSVGQVAGPSTAASVALSPAITTTAENEKDKVKVKQSSTGAKKIAKDMQRWAKQMNKVSAAKQTAVKQFQMELEAQEAKEEAMREKLKSQEPDVFKKPVGFAMSGKSEVKSVGVKSLFTSDVEDESPLVVLSAANKRKPAKSLVAEYGDNDSDDELELERDKFTDWKLLACLLCQRQFPSRDVLVKHQQLSDLHKKNLEDYRKKLISEVQQINAQIRGGK